MNILGILDYETFSCNYIRVAKLVESSITCLWFRIKCSDESVIYEKSKLLRGSISSCKLILSDNFSIAKSLRFDGVHLNDNSIPLERIRAINKELIIGYSAHTYNEVENINADYFTLSPIFESKTELKEVITPNININTNKKIYALGGAKLNDYDKATSYGFYGIAGIRILSDIIDYKSLK